MQQPKANLATNNRHRLNLTIHLVLIFITSFSWAQKHTIVSGTVIDGQTKEVVPFASISILSAPDKGTAADANGYFTLTTTLDSGTLLVTATGYARLKYPFRRDSTRNLVITLSPEAVVLNEVVISVKKPKYRNRNNPAVEFIREVIAYKDSNNAKKLENYSLKHYEKLILSFSVKKDSNSKNPFLLRKYPFLMTQVDSTRQKGRTLIPIYLAEKSEVHHKVKGQSMKPIVTGTQQSRIDQYLDEDGLDEFMDKIYGEPDIYNHDIALGNRRILSPVAETAPLFYEYYLRDTIKTSKPWQLLVMVSPKNKEDALFNGYLSVTLDGHYAVTKADLTVGSKANINWLDDISVTMQYRKDADRKYYLQKSTMSLNMGIVKNGMELFGEKTYMIYDFVPGALSIDDVTTTNFSEVRTGTPNYGKVERPVPLSVNEVAALQNVDSLKASHSFRQSMAFGAFLLSGYANAGPVEVGPVTSFYSFNPIEGSRLKFGGRTTDAFSRRIVLDGYLAYGVRDRFTKYRLGATLSLTKRSIYEFPVRSISAVYTSDIQIPGQELAFSSSDNFLLSFRRGNNNKIWYSEKWQFEHLYETNAHLSFKLGIRQENLIGGGALRFELNESGRPGSEQNLQTSEVYSEVRWAPHETFFQGKRYRRPIDKGYPVFTLNSAIGIKGFAGGQFNYNRIGFQVRKRFFLSQLGNLDVATEAGAVFGKLPYPLLIIHRANQTYAYQMASYNLMNFLEFISDRYVGINAQHYFNGFILNKVPLVKKLKLREIVTVKALWGTLSERNNPDRTQGLFKMPVAQDGSLLSLQLGLTPYVEGSFGISNIFKVLRVDVVRRFTYLHHKGAPLWGIRLKVNVDF